MSHLMFHRTVRGSIIAQVRVHTDRGLRTAAQEMILADPEAGLTKGEARVLVAELFKQVDNTRANASKGKTGGTE